jgi:hypothetical protein
VVCNGNYYNIIFLNCFYNNIYIFSIGKCPTASVMGFVATASVSGEISLDGDRSYSLVGDGTDNGTTVVPGSYVLMKCSSGYVNVGGPLNITCVGDSWSTYPNCILNSGSGSMTTTTTTTMPPSSGSGCTWDATSYGTSYITNGYPINSSLTPVTATTVIGNITTIHFTVFIFNIF